MFRRWLREWMLVTKSQIELNELRHVWFGDGHEHVDPLKEANAQDKIQIGVLKKTTEDELDDLVELVETIATGFLEKILAVARCHKVEHSPLFVPDHLKERRQFTSVIELSLKEIIRT